MYDCLWEYLVTCCHIFVFVFWALTTPRFWEKKHWLVFEPEQYTVWDKSAVFLNKNNVLLLKRSPEQCVALERAASCLWRRMMLAFEEEDRFAFGARTTSCLWGRVRSCLRTSTMNESERLNSWFGVEIITMFMEMVHGLWQHCRFGFKHHSAVFDRCDIIVLEKDASCKQQCHRCCDNDVIMSHVSYRRVSVLMFIGSPGGRSYWKK